MCGEVKSKKDEKTASTPLVTVSDLQRMKMFEVIILRLRKQPFKTKLTPNFKIDWGKKYPIAKYPTRDKREVHTFDIKEFVKNQKKKKLLEMMNSAEASAAGSTDSFNKFKSRSEEIANEREQGKGIMTSRKPDASFSSPFLERKTEEKKPSFEQVGIPTYMPDFEKKVDNKPIQKPKVDDSFNFDVDELVKKIDAKIAELEEEEKKNKEQELTTPKLKEEQVQQVTPIVTSPVVNSNVNANTNTNTNANANINDLELSDDGDDDDFFDDFFDN